ncbi:MFS transporter [Paenibacillus sp. FSL H8-0548]|uniref:MFS transporter n=1 Tax=Paenibacillus sp. FSL H8-0548 TaxID=1920422 RepID=UPI00096C8B2B|nr:MFS transporter [Paenibacillus sp. FSL H8-0548]OMF37133.1 MFS transporter [Paenibacillus sp. FSL H8-0548]
MSSNQASVAVSPSAIKTIFPLLFAISFVHLINDTIQSVVPALFPILKDSLSLSFAQIGLISLMINLTAALLQPVIGIFSDSHPKPMMLPIGMLFTLGGVAALSYATQFWMVMTAVMLIGIGSAVFHPISARVAYMAAGKRKGTGQSIFQFGGNLGQSLAPIMTAVLFVHTGQRGVIWFALVVTIGVIIQFNVAKWYGNQLSLMPVSSSKKAAKPASNLNVTTGKVVFAITILMILVFSKNVYIAAISSYYSFYAIEHFGLSVSQAQIVLFVFLAANVIGLLLGGMLADRFSRRSLIWFSILGTAPFALLLPYANLTFSIILIFFAGLILASAFSVILVYANELLPGRVGLVSGVFFGMAFGLAGIGSAVLGNLADEMGIEFVIRCTSYLPLLGMLTILLPSDRKGQAEQIS